MHYHLSDYLLDLIQNAVESRAVRIVVRIQERDGLMAVTIADNGVGMDAPTLARARDPFFTDGKKHPGRAVGLGIPFLVQLCETTGGSHQIESAVGIGTTLRFSFSPGHIDAPPGGDLAGTLVEALCFEGAYEMVIQRVRGTAEYELRRSELQDALGELESVGSRMLLRQFVEESERSLYETEEEAAHGQDDAR